MDSFVLITDEHVNAGQVVHNAGGMVLGAYADARRQTTVVGKVKVTVFACPVEVDGQNVVVDVSQLRAGDKLFITTL